MLEFTVIKDQSAEISLAGELLFSDHDEFRKVVQRVSTARCKSCVFELSALEAIDSAGIGMLLLAADEAAKHGFTLSLKGPIGQVKRLLELTRLADVIPVTA